MSGKLYGQIKAAAQAPPEKSLPPSEAFIKSAGQVWLRRYWLDENFIGFQGHFEGRPILPALAQVLMAKESAGAILNKEVFIEAVSHGKFSAPVRPGMFISVYAQAPHETGGNEWRFHLRCAAPREEESDVSFLRLKIKGR